MGGEVLVPIAWFCGAVTLVWLIVRSIQPQSRPYALPTLVASAITAEVLIRQFPNPDYPVGTALALFFFGALAFGIHAHAIRWLAQRTNKRAAS